jgi:hypothetical protein
VSAKREPPPLSHGDDIDRPLSPTRQRQCVIGVNGRRKCQDLGLPFSLPPLATVKKRTRIPSSILLALLHTFSSIFTHTTSEQSGY